MEKENTCSSLCALTDSVLQLTQQDSWTPLEFQLASEIQPADMWTETQAEMEQVREMYQHGESQTDARASPEEMEQWEQIVWPVRPLSSTSPPLSSAMVEWDMPDPHLTDYSLANQLDAGCTSHIDIASLSLHHFQDVDDKVLAVEGKAEDVEVEEEEEEEEQEQEEEKNWINSPLLDSVLKETANDLELCNAVDKLGPRVQEKEDSARELLDALTEVPQVVDVELEDRCSAASDSAESVGSVDFTDNREDEALSFVHLKLEEEQEEPDVLLSRQEEPEDELTPPQPTVKGPEIEEEGEKENEELKEEVVEEIKVKKEEEKELVEQVKVKLEEECNVEEDKEEEGKEEVEELKEEDKENIQQKEKEAVKGSELEEKHEGKEDHSASLFVNVDVAARVLSTDHAALTDVQLSKLLEKRQRSSSNKDAPEAPEGLHETPAGRTEESEMCKDAEHSADSAVATHDDPEVVTQAVDYSTILEDLGVEADDKDQETSCLQQQELLEQPSDQRQHPAEEQPSREPSGGQQHLDEEKGEVEVEETRPEGADWLAVESAICVEAEHPTVSGRREQTEPVERKEQTGSELQPMPPQETNESEVMEQQQQQEQQQQEQQQQEQQQQEQQRQEQQQQQQPAEATVEHQVTQVDELQEAVHRMEVVVADGSDVGSLQTLLANGKQTQGPETTAPHPNGTEVDRQRACRLAERLFNLDGIQQIDVVKHVDKDNDFSRAVGEEYLKFFDFTGQTLDCALRSFLKVVVLIGETQERERVLQHFSCRFHQCNPESFPSPGPILALTCALMLLNTDLHGQNVGKCMSSSKFVSNLDGMNEGENFGRDLLKSLYNSIKSEPLQWAINEGELMSSMSVDEGLAEVVSLRSKTNPFQDVPHDNKAVEVKQGLLQRKIHADVDGKRTPWGKRGWKTFNGVLKGMVLYLQKLDYRSDQQVTEEVISVHHSLAERAADYTKKPHVFRLQTADWRVFLVQATCKVEMYSWINRINLISALHSSPPFPAAVGSQRRFSRPILPSSQSAHTLERQLQSYSGMLESFRIDLSHLQSNPPEGKKSKTKELEEHRTRAEYLHHEVCRYKTYVQVLEAWKSLRKMDSNRLNEADLRVFDKAACADSIGDDEEEDEDLKRSHSSPALELEAVPSSVVKVKRNISERRTYRKPIIPRSSKES